MLCVLQSLVRTPPDLPSPPPALQEMDVEGEMQRGLLPGTIALSSKFVPALKKVSAQTFESARTLLAESPAAGGDTRGARGSDDGGAMRGGAAAAAAGLRSRRQREVELSEGASLGSTSRFAAEAGASRKDE